MSSNAPLSASDRFEILEQLNLHQRCIDNDGSRASADKYVDLYWPGAKFTVRDLRSQEFVGAVGLKQLYDYAHSVFPIHKWKHGVGTFIIEGSGDTATAEWNWTVSWRSEKEGIVSTGTYKDKFERREGVWKCVERFSDIDPNWPGALFQPWVDQAATTFKAS